MSYNYDETFKYPINACLNLTDNCNLQCRYCFVHQKPHYMSLEMAKNAIDFLAKNLVKYKELTGRENQKNEVTFFGGEPTLLWEQIIVPIVEYTKEKYPDTFHFDMTTNGTLLNEERVKFCYDNGIKLLLSIDGIKEVQDYNRPCRDTNLSSFDLVEKNIPIILKYFPNTTFRSTLYQPTIDKMFESFLFAEKCGFRQIFMCPNAREEWSEENIKILKEEIGKIITYTTMNYIEGKIPILYSNLDSAFDDIIDIDLQTYTKNFADISPSRGVRRCGLGTGSISIAYDGKIYGCQEQDSRDENDYFYIGNIFDGINIEKHKKMLTDYNEAITIISSKKELCDYCKLRQACIHKVCPSVSHDMFNDFFIRPSIDCIYNQILLEGGILMMKILVEQEKNQFFKKYLDYKLEGGESIGL